MNAYIRRILTQCVKAVPTVRRRPARRTMLRIDSLEDRTTPVTLTVNAITDTGAGSGTTGDLRYCMNQANTLAGLDSIVFSLPAGLQTININATALPPINGDLTITNTTGASNLVIRRNTGNFGIFSLAAATTNVTFDGITISNGSGTLGGGITGNTAANITVRNCIISGNTGSFGGGIYIPTGVARLTIQNSTVSGNSGGSGGVYFYYGGSLLIQNSTINNNTGTSTFPWTGGGVIFYGPVGAGGVVIENSTIVNNTTQCSGGGGGVNFRTVGGTATIRNSTITGNTAPAGAA